MWRISPRTGYGLGRKWNLGCVTYADNAKTVQTPNERPQATVIQMETPPSPTGKSFPQKNAYKIILWFSSRDNSKTIANKSAQNSASPFICRASSLSNSSSVHFRFSARAAQSPYNLAFLESRASP